MSAGLVLSIESSCDETGIAVIEEGVRAADSGQFIDNARPKAKWEARLAAALDETRRARPG